MALNMLSKQGSKLCSGVGGPSHFTRAAHTTRPTAAPAAALPGCSTSGSSSPSSSLRVGRAGGGGTLFTPYSARPNVRAFASGAPQGLSIDLTGAQRGVRSDRPLRAACVHAGGQAACEGAPI